MNLLSNDFRLNLIRMSLREYHHTDAMDGIKLNFIARMIKGTSRFVGDGFDLTFRPGDIFFIPIGCRYHSYWDGDEIVWDSLGFTYFPDAASFPIQRIDGIGEIDSIFDKLIVSGTADCEAIGMLYSLIARLKPLMHSYMQGKNSLVSLATQYMSENPTVTIPEVARFCRVSESGLYSAFRAIGTTPVETRLKGQIDRASALLASTDLTVEDICDRCGFSSPSYFYRVLKRMTGKSSRDLRRGRMM